MSDELLVILGGAVLVLLVILWTVLLWARSRSMRSLLQGIGLLLLVAGAWIAGFLALALHGLRSIYDWAQRTVMDNTMIAGLSVLGVGVLLFLIGMIIHPIPKQEAKLRRDAHRDARKSARQPETSTGLAAVDSGTTPDANRNAPAKQATAAPEVHTTAEDAEVEDILKQRGIE